jgi:bifunctional DNA-binding transcriptional regulator/antitoxin component of YhaV-PrlF toxin-antitoxin module
MEIALTRISSKGQIVIPAHMRGDIAAGTDFILVKEGNRFVIRPVSDLEEDLRDDITFAERTDRAIERYNKEKFISQGSDEFLSDLDTW